MFPTFLLKSPPRDIDRFWDFTAVMVTLRSSTLSSLAHFTRTSSSLIFHGHFSSSVSCTGTESSGSSICRFPNEHLLVLQHNSKPWGALLVLWTVSLFFVLPVGNAQTWNQFSALNPFFPPRPFSVFHLWRGYSFWHQRNLIGQTIHVNTTYNCAELLVLAWLSQRED